MGGIIDSGIRTYNREEQRNKNPKIIQNESVQIAVSFPDF